MRADGWCSVVNVQKAGEVYRCNVCGNLVLVTEAGGGELLCHGEPMMLVEVLENQSG
jgi:desulfoferrodoxin-like iron-binding protein